MQLPISKRRRVIAGGVAVAALGLGGTGIAIAQSGGETKAPYASSVTAPDSSAESGNNDAALAALAKITPEQAKAAALAAVPGKAGAVELEDEDGNVVFGVEVTTADGRTIDVKVDAGDGKVLAQADDANESDAKGGNDKESTTEANEPAPQPTKR